MLKRNAELKIRAGVALEKLSESDRTLAQICLNCTQYSVRLAYNRHNIRYPAHFCGEQFRTWISRDPHPKPKPGCPYQTTMIADNKKKETRVLHVT